MSLTSPHNTPLRRAAALAAAGLVTAVLALGGAAAAHAKSDPSLTSNPTSATAGGDITLTAAHFEANERLEFSIDGTTPLLVSAARGNAVTTDDNGGYEGLVTIPAGLAPGDHEISAAQFGSVNQAASVTITVVAQPTSSVSPATQSLSSYLKDGVTATFSGFAPGATVSFGIATPGTGDQAGPDAVADATGTVTLRFVPEAGTNYANEGEYFLSASSNGGAVRAADLTFAVTADSAASAPVAGPATPVKRAATFTG